MTPKKKYLSLAFILIIIFQILLYTNNNKRSSFIFFKWTVKEVSIGKLISYSFISGLFISTLLNKTIASYKKNTLEDIDEDYEPYNKKENNKTYVEMPPQRDLRDAQPTISVNYRVVKNTEENNFRSDKNYKNNIDNKDDWDIDNNDW
tara:strand:- start:39 stop:482 length:444 start_codon:yes stop_codon:yes gene_type:complete